MSREKVIDLNGGMPPLRLTRRKERRVSSRRILGPCITVRCGCCKVKLEIYPEGTTGGTIEIGGVLGTRDQWRQVLLPVLGMEYRPDAG